ncbi:hypothetical protein [Erythrobacter oryzae]|uniref:hypothetical protein n=1 Tax=Erythrobacter oryzae TaxID=3019556 RepID=UPI0025579C77|nr:hypothetical protein [Erythrobacter sp. COR-2]
MQGRLHFLAAALALGLVTACAPNPEREREAIKRELLTHPETRQLWRAVERHYPAEFAELVEKIRAFAPAERSDSLAMRRVIDTWLVKLLDSTAPDIAHASPEMLRKMVKADVRFTETLAQVSPDLCARYDTEGGITLGDEPELAKAKAAMVKLNAATITASAEGRDSPVQHAEPSQAERDKAGANLLAQGIDQDTLQALGSPAAIRALQKAEVCELALGIKRAIAELPDDALARMVAYQVSQQSPAPQRRSGNTRR